MRHHRDHPPHDRPTERRRASDRSARVATMIRLVRRAGKDPDAIRAALNLAAWRDATPATIDRLIAKAEATIAERRRAAGARLVAECGIRKAIAALADAGDAEAERTAGRLAREAARLATEAAALSCRA